MKTKKAHKFRSITLNSQANKDKEAMVLGQKDRMKKQTIFIRVKEPEVGETKKQKLLRIEQKFISSKTTVIRRPTVARIQVRTKINQEQRVVLRTLETLDITEVTNPHHEKVVSGKREVSPLSLETARWILLEEKLIPK
jgi:hypothetical protein